MRKIFNLLSLTIISFWIVSCQNESQIFVNDIDGAKPEKQIRSKEDALKIALDAATKFEVTETRSARTKTVSDKNVEVIRVKSGTRAAEENNNALYIVNYDNEQGFVVISANPETASVLAYIDEGSYSSEMLGDNGFTEFIDRAINYSLEPDGIKIPDLPPGDLREYREENDTTYNQLSPLVTVKWGQEDIFGEYAPNGISGCINTAMAQAMTYFQRPQILTLTFSNAPYNSITLHWASIKTFVSIFDYPSSLVDDWVKEEIGLLHRQLGVKTNSSYNVGSTGSNINRARSAFNNLGYHCTNISTGYIDTYPAGGSIVYMTGVDSSTNKGHAWLIDGYKEWIYTYRCYSRPIFYPEEGWRLDGEMEHIETYFHINWGFDGICNGYFLRNVYNFNNGYLYDSSYNYLGMQRNYNSQTKYFKIML